MSITNYFLHTFLCKDDMGVCKCVVGYHFHVGRLARHFGVLHNSTSMVAHRGTMRRSITLLEGKKGLLRMLMSCVPCKMNILKGKSMVMDMYDLEHMQL